MMHALISSIHASNAFVTHPHAPAAQFFRDGNTGNVLSSYMRLAALPVPADCTAAGAQLNRIKWFAVALELVSRAFVGMTYLDDSPQGAHPSTTLLPLSTDARRRPSPQRRDRRFELDIFDTLRPTGNNSSYPVVGMCPVVLGLGDNARAALGNAGQLLPIRYTICYASESDPNDPVTEAARFIDTYDATNSPFLSYMRNHGVGAYETIDEQSGPLRRRLQRNSTTTTDLLPASNISFYGIFTARFMLVAGGSAQSLKFTGTRLRWSEDHHRFEYKGAGELWAVDDYALPAAGTFVANLREWYANGTTFAYELPMVRVARPETPLFNRNQPPPPVMARLRYALKHTGSGRRRVECTVVYVNWEAIATALCNVPKKKMDMDALLCDCPDEVLIPERPSKNVAKTELVRAHVAARVTSLIPDLLQEHLPRVLADLEPHAQLSEQSLAKALLGVLDERRPAPAHWIADVTARYDPYAFDSDADDLEPRNDSLDETNVGYFDQPY